MPQKERNNLGTSLLLCFALTTISETAIAQSQVLVSKSTTIYLADSRFHQLQPKGLLYLPAGVRLISYDQKVKYRGLNRRLILTETGIWGYIIDNEKHYWGTGAINQFKKSNNIVFIRRTFDTKIPLGKDVNLGVTLTRGEWYPLKEDLGENIKVSLDNRKIGEKLGPISFEVNIERDYINVLDLTSTLNEKEIHAYGKSIVDGIAGIEKACDTKQVTGIKFGESAGFSLEKFFINLGISQSAETRRTEEFGENVSVTRTYYVRSGKRGFYKITKLQSCDGKQIETYRVVAPGNRNISINENWSKNLKLKTNKRTGQVLVSCAPQYFQFYDELSNRDFLDDEIPFIISRTASFSGIGSINKCTQ